MDKQKVDGDLPEDIICPVLDTDKYNKQVDKYVNKYLSNSLAELRLCLIYHSCKNANTSREFKSKRKQSSHIQNIINSLIYLQTNLKEGFSDGTKKG